MIRVSHSARRASTRSYSLSEDDNALPRTTQPANEKCDFPEFPLLAMVISGGHTQIIYMAGHNQFEIIGTTRDDAVGECFDKVAKILGLPYPGGPSIDKISAISSLSSPVRSHRTSSTARSATPASLNSLDTEASSKTSAIVLAAIKYAFLKYKMGGDIVFDPQESVSTNGNSGVYLLYSVVRAKKILQKASGDTSSARSAGGHGSASEAEMASVRALNKKLVQYEDVLREAVAGKAPYKVCAYLYELAQEFSRFYENVKVAGSEREAELLTIVRAYVKVMEHGLGLLGITELPEEM